jgi:hypothetical protein
VARCLSMSASEMVVRPVSISSSFVAAGLIGYPDLAIAGSGVPAELLDIADDMPLRQDVDLVAGKNPVRLAGGIKRLVGLMRDKRMFFVA